MLRIQAHEIILMDCSSHLWIAGKAPCSLWHPADPSARGHHVLVHGEAGLARGRAQASSRGGQALLPPAEGDEHPQRKEVQELNYAHGAEADEYAADAANVA